ncbi:hypothetical protein BDP27DRAFT_1451254 [Rhodocollybia butyracea]|uniref:Uncharacterized protein n=1 Tax=Rhodocollybia butyracea TaxID=206335 RepID=A0A9P5U389_9AGAR|nr:hypothetical protein BDP27DRAFT_1451254 [Rhodocollybia butyracea]
MFFTLHLLGFVLLGVLLISPACAAPTSPSPPPYSGPSTPPPSSLNCRPSTPLPTYGHLSYKVQVVNIAGYPVQVPSATQILLKKSIKKVVDKMHGNSLPLDLMNIEVVAEGDNLQFHASDMLYYKLKLELSTLSEWCTSAPCSGYVVTPEKNNPSEITYGGLLSTCDADHFVTQEPLSHEADVALLEFLTSFVPIEEAARQMAKGNRLAGNLNTEVLQILSGRRKLRKKTLWFQF